MNVAQRPPEGWSQEKKRDQTSLLHKKLCLPGKSPGFLKPQFFCLPNGSDKGH